MSILKRLRRRDHRHTADPNDPRGVSAPLPDPSKPPARRGSWEQAALVNTAITESVKRQLGTVTPPWKK